MKANTDGWQLHLHVYVFCIKTMLLITWDKQKNLTTGSCLIFPQYDAMMFGPNRMEIHQSRCVATAPCGNWGALCGDSRALLVCVS